LRASPEVEEPLADDEETLKNAYLTRLAAVFERIGPRPKG
jgi:hypothetical protein